MHLSLLFQNMLFRTLILLGLVELGGCLDVVHGRSQVLVAGGKLNSGVSSSP